MKTVTKTTKEHFTKVVLSSAILVGLLFPSVVFGAASCITDPWPWWSGEDNRCGVFTTVTPSASSVLSGSSVDVQLYAQTLYQWWTNGLIDIDTTMVDNVTGVVTSPLYTGYISLPTGTFKKTVNTGPLTHSVTVSIWAMSDQLVTNSDTTIITVTSPPTVNINFSFLDKAKSFVSGILVNKVFAVNR